MPDEKLLNIFVYKMSLFNLTLRYTNKIKIRTLLNKSKLAYYESAGESDFH
jgi:hypothetical protein